MSTTSKIIIFLMIVLGIAGGVYWYLFFYGPGNGEVINNPTNTGTTGGFIPLNAPNGQSSTGGKSNTDTGTTNDTTTNATSTIEQAPVPALRLLSESPIGGYGASTTASTTIIRWIDRGRGNIMEARSDTPDSTTLSNTILPRVYDSIWDKNLTSLIGSILPANTDTQTTVYARLNKQIATSTATSSENVTPFFLRGKNLPENMLGYAVSPKGDKIIMIIKENNQSVGYTANFDGTSVTKIFTNPVTQLVVEWPEESTIAITTKASSKTNGYLYFINPKTGLWKKIIGPVYGLGTKVSHDAKRVLASSSGRNGQIMTNIYTVGTTTVTDTTLRTLAEKCTWGKFYKELVYCATPSVPISATYPDDWYRGIISTYDKVWQLNANNNDIRLVSSLINQADRAIDVFNISTDPKDDYLLFMNKADLSFWSLDLSTN
jgi:hypothetical protein